MLAPPRRDDPEALIPEARDRQRRRRLLGAAAIAILAGLAVGAYAIVGSGSPGTTVSRPAAGGIRPCRSSQTSSSLDIPDGLPGVTTAWLILANHGNAPCSLPDRAPTVRITWHGTRLPATELHGRYLVDASWEPIRTVHVLRPRQRAAINFDWKNFCGPPYLSYRPIPTYQFRFDGELTVATHFGPRASCTDPTERSTILVSRPLLVR